MITIYHNPRCKKSRETLQLLNEQKENLEIVEYLKTPPSQEDLRKICDLLGLKPEELVRKGETLFKEKFANRELTDEEWLVILSTNPILIERPIVVKDQQAVIGRPPENIKKLL